MLTKFFSTTKPATVIVVLTYMTLGFFYCNNSLFTSPFEWIHTLKILGMWLLFILAMFLLNFISQKNDLTKNSTYRILLFGALALSLPSALRDGNILLAGVLILMALRRVISLRSELYMERKVFDATLLILLASLMVFYSWLFIIVIYLTIVFYRIAAPRFLFIPFIAIFCFVILWYAILLFMAGTPQEVLLNLPAISFDFKEYNNFQIILAIAFLGGTLLWTIWKYIADQNRASTAFRSRYSVILGILLMSFVLILFINDKSGAEWYFTLPAISIIVSNYLENTESLLFKECLLWLILVLPVVIYIV